MVEECRCQEVLRGDLGILARAESGGTRLAGSMELRRPECIRSTIARRPARMLSSPRSRGRASVRHSRAVSTPPVRSVHRMIRSDRWVVAGSWGPLSSGVAVGWRGKHADEEPDSNRGHHDFRRYVNVPVVERASCLSCSSTSAASERSRSQSAEALAARSSICCARSDSAWAPRTRLAPLSR